MRDPEHRLIRDRERSVGPHVEEDVESDGDDNGGDGDTCDPR
jgi:hypothetical protein